MIEGRVEMTTYMGERSHMHVRVPGLEQPLAISLQNSTIQGAAPAQDAGPVWLTWSDGALITLMDK